MLHGFNYSEIKSDVHKNRVYTLNVIILEKYLKINFAQLPKNIYFYIMSRITVKVFIHLK